MEECGPVARVKPVTLDLSFLAVPLRSLPAGSRPVNVYDILREGWRETRVDMTLQFFLDPNERHGFGSLVIDALLRSLDGAPLISASGKTSNLFSAADYVGSDAWEIVTQVEYIDVYAVNRERGIAIVLENKIGHDLDNPLDWYASRAFSDVDDVLVAVLAPETRTAKDKQELWLSRAITYRQLADEIRQSPGLIDHALDPPGRDERRSLDLLQQFIEARSGEATVADLASEGARLDEWRTLLAEHQDAIAQFERSKKEIARMLRSRNKELCGTVARLLDEAGLPPAQQWAGGAPSGDDFWSVFKFDPDNWQIELKLSTLADRPSIYVYDHQNYKRSSTQALGLDWSASDDEIAKAFVNRVRAILLEVSAGMRGARK